MSFPYYLVEEPAAPDVQELSQRLRSLSGRQGGASRLLAQLIPSQSVQVCISSFVSVRHPIQLARLIGIYRHPFFCPTLVQHQVLSLSTFRARSFPRPLFHLKTSIWAARLCWACRGVVLRASDTPVQPYCLRRVRQMAGMLLRHSR